MTPVCPIPSGKSDPKLGVTVTFSAPQVTPEVRKLLQNLDEAILRRDLQGAMGLKDDEHFRNAYLLPVVHAGFVEMTIPDKPRSSKQSYRFRALGRAVSAKSIRAHS